MRRLLTAALVLLLAAPALAKDIYVSKETGSNSNPGTKEAPKKLLWRVIGELAEGDRVLVAEGIYHGRGKSGVMPRCAVSNVTLEGGWKADFSERDPFRYLTVIAPPPDKQGAGTFVLDFQSPTNKLEGITIDGFCIDRGPHNYYYGEGEPGANKAIEGHQDNTCWGYRALNRKKSGSDPTINILGRGGSFTVRNCLLINNPWWGIYVKGGGEGEITIENNLVLVSQGRGIEAITGGGWGKPTWVIRNNTVMFNHSLKTTEGRALSSDPRKGYGRYVVERNVFAYSDGGGITVKFNAEGDALALNNNLFFFNRRGDFCVGGSGLCVADDFEDELLCDNADNIHACPKTTAKIAAPWLDRWSMRSFVDMLAGEFNTWEKLEEARAVHGLGPYRIPGYDQTYADYGSLPDMRNNYDMSRYPRPMKKGEEIDWMTAVIPIVGAEGEWGIQRFKP